MGLFIHESSQDVSAIVETFISIFWPAFLFNGINIVIAAYLTAMHKPIPSAVIAVLRSFALPAAGILLLPALMGSDGIFWAIPVAEMITFVLAGVLLFVLSPSRLIKKPK